MDVCIANADLNGRSGLISADSKYKGLEMVLFQLPQRVFAAVTATVILVATSCGNAQAQAENTRDCYRLNTKDYLIGRLRNAQIAKSDLTLTIAVTNDDVIERSGTQAEWEAAIKSGLSKWTDALREQMTPLGVNIPTVNFSVGTVATSPNYDLKLIIHAEGVTEAPGVPPMFDADSTKPKFTAFTAPADELSIRPAIHVFPSSQGWGRPGKQRVNLQKDLLLHETGHAWGLLDIYDNSKPAGRLVPRQGFSGCTDNVMYKPRQNLGSGDKAGIKAKYLAALGGGGGPRGQVLLSSGQAFPNCTGCFSTDYSEGRFWIESDDPILDADGGGSSGGYLLDGFGGIHPFGGATQLNTSGAPYWPGWDIARSLTVLADASGGWVLDGFGGIHNFGSAPYIQTPAYWPNWDIARDLVVLAKPTGGYMGYVLDGWGGLHPFNGAPYFPQQGQRLQSGQYSASMVFHAGQDSARGLMIVNDVVGGPPTGGLVIEKNGVVTRFGEFGAEGDYHYIDPRFPLLNHSLQWSKFMVMPNGSWYARGPSDPAQGLQTFILQPFGNPTSIVVPNLWGNWDIVRDVVPYKPDCVPRTDMLCLQ